MSGDNVVEIEHTVPPFPRRRQQQENRRSVSRITTVIPRKTVCRRRVRIMMSNGTGTTPSGRISESLVGRKSGKICVCVWKNSVLPPEAIRRNGLKCSNAEENSNTGAPNWPLLKLRMRSCAGKDFPDASLWIPESSPPCGFPAEIRL